ncbi:hypothetical protein THAOC_15335, partial [Thalassiosira oceanica]
NVGKEAPGSEAGHTQRRGRMRIDVLAHDEKDGLRRREDAEKQLFFEIERQRCPGYLYEEQGTEIYRKARQLAKGDLP